MYLDMPDYFQIVNGYLLSADQLEKSQAHQGRQHLAKLGFLFNIMDIPSLADIHASGLREINHSLNKVFSREKKGKHERLCAQVVRLPEKEQIPSMNSAWQFLIASRRRRRKFSLKNSHPLVDTFIDELIAYGFQYPEIKGSTTEWQVKVNPAHITNIRIWLEISE